MDTAGNSTFPGPQERELAHRLGDLERAAGTTRKLQQVILGVLLLLLVMQGVGTYHQIRWLRNQAAQLNSATLELAKVLGDYETNTLPAFNRLYNDLNRYAQSHPDYARLLARFRMAADEPRQTNAPAAVAPARR
jgi:hypothetical protein